MAEHFDMNCCYVWHLLNFICSKWWEKSDSLVEKQNIILQRIVFLLLFKWGYSDVVQFESIQILPCGRRVDGAKSKEGEFFTSANAHARTIVLSFHKTETLKFVLNLPRVLCYLGKRADSHEGKEKTRRSSSCMKETEWNTSLGEFPLVQRPSQISI